MKPEDLIDQFNECMAPTQKVNMKTTTAKLTAKQSMAQFKAMKSINVEHVVDGRVVATSIPVVGVDIKGCGSDYKCQRADPETMRKIQVHTSKQCARTHLGSRHRQRVQAKNAKPKQEIKTLHQVHTTEGCIEIDGHGDHNLMCEGHADDNANEGYNAGYGGMAPMPAPPARRHLADHFRRAGFKVCTYVRACVCAYRVRGRRAHARGRRAHARGRRAHKRTNNTGTHMIAQHYHVQVSKDRRRLLSSRRGVQETGVDAGVHKPMFSCDVSSVDDKEDRGSPKPGEGIMQDKAPEHSKSLKVKYRVSQDPTKCKTEPNVVEDFLGIKGAKVLSHKRSMVTGECLEPQSVEQVVRVKDKKPNDKEKGIVHEASEYEIKFKRDAAFPASEMVTVTEGATGNQISFETAASPPPAGHGTEMPVFRAKFTPGADAGTEIPAVPVNIEYTPKTTVDDAAQETMPTPAQIEKVNTENKDKPWLQIPEYVPAHMKHRRRYIQIHR